MASAVEEVVVGEADDGGESVVDSVRRLGISEEVIASGGEDEDEDEEEGWERGLAGFVQEVGEDKWRVARQYFPSKAGGPPAWLDPVNLPRGKQVLCGICEMPLVFVVQVYAPVDGDDSAFHRTLFLFMCSSMACLQQDQHQQRKHLSGKPNRSVKVFRSQLSRKNPYYSADAPQEDGQGTPLCCGTRLCTWCGTWRGGLLCSGCKQTRYCSRTHQVDHWRAEHAPFCRKVQGSLQLDNPDVGTDSYDCHNTSPASSVTSSEIDNCGVQLLEIEGAGPNANCRLWPEFELLTDELGEEWELNSQDNDRAQILLEDYEKRRTVERELTAKELQDVREVSLEEQHWASFQARMSKAPDQVLWYCRSMEAKPIWPTLSGQPKPNDIPPCTQCGGHLTFEFQLLPQLLYYFKAGDDPDIIDWGTIAVYSCERSCPIEGYVEEFAWVQLGVC